MFFKIKDFIGTLIICQRALLACGKPRVRVLK
jgi:hypothetical protein